MIRPWEPKDIEQLRPMVHRFLEIMAQRGGDWVASDHNVALYIGMGLAAAQKGEPALLWAEDDGTVVSFNLWCSMATPFEMRWKTLWAIGSYTLPEFEHRKIASMVRLECLEMAKRLGFERVTGPVHLVNEKGRKVFAGEWDAFPVAEIYERFL